MCTFYDNVRRERINRTQVDVTSSIVSFNSNPRQIFPILNPTKSKIFKQSKVFTEIWTQNLRILSKLRLPTRFSIYENCLKIRKRNAPHILEFDFCMVFDEEL